MPFAAVNGQNLFYEDTGEPPQRDKANPPVLIFSHGLLMDHTMFAPQVAAFRGRHRCISWDERAHGQTAGSEIAPFSYYDSAADLAALLGHLGIDKAVLVGMSQGGYLSLRAALRTPQIVQALVLIDTQAGPEDASKMPAYNMLVQQWASHGLSAESAAMIEHIILGTGWAGGAEWKAKWATWKPHNLFAAFHTLGSRDDIDEEIKKINAPTLVIHGDQDVAISVASAERMAESIPGARIELVAGGGHAANLTHAEAVNPLIERFLASLS